MQRAISQRLRPPQDEQEERVCLKAEHGTARAFPSSRLRRLESSLCSRLIAHETSYTGTNVRVRILKPFAGVIDGISLGALMPGLTYDLPSEVAQRLIVERIAREDLTHQPVVLNPAGYDENDAELVDHVTRGVRVTQALPGESEGRLRGPPKTKP
jgi:hypothetical protein